MRDLTEECIRARFRFERENGGRKPEAILVGPLEYFQIWVENHECVPCELSLEGAEGLRFCGLPLRIKTTPGIDFEIKPEMASRFAAKVTQ